MPLRSMAFSCVVIAITALTPLRASPRPNQWTIRVAEIGPMLVPLGADAIAAGIPTGFELRDPAGALVGGFVSTAPEGQVEARLVSMDEAAEGWRMVFDLGRIPFQHDRFDVVAVELGYAADCVLEASHDLKQFRTLVRGDLSWVGRDRRLQRTSLEYPAADERFLALRWPRTAGTPRFDAVHVRALESGGHAELAILLEPRVSSGVRYYYVPDGSTAIDALRWEFPSTTGVSTSLVLVSQAGRWGELGSTNAREFAATEAVGAGRAVRLETRGDDGSRIEPQNVVGVTRPRWLVFDATVTGAYRLSTAAASPPPAMSPRLGRVASRVNLSQPQHRSAGVLPDDPFLPRAAEIPRKARRFALDVPSDATGIMRLPLSESLLTAVGSDTHGMRLMSAGGDLPFLRETSDVPELAMVRHGREVLDTTLPPTGGMITQLELSGVDPGPAGLTLTWALGGQRAMEWTERFERRDPQALVPIHRFFDARPIADQRRLTLTGLSDAQVANATLHLWREADALLFVKPVGPLDLLDGFTPDPVPYPELEPYRSALTREAVWLPVQAQPAGDVAAGNRWSRPLLIGAELLAAAVLLFVLWRALRRFTHNPPAGIS